MQEAEDSVVLYVVDENGCPLKDGLILKITPGGIKRQANEAGVAGTGLPLDNYGAVKTD